MSEKKKKRRSIREIENELIVDAISKKKLFFLKKEEKRVKRSRKVWKGNKNKKNKTEREEANVIAEKKLKNSYKKKETRLL